MQLQESESKALGAYWFPRGALGAHLLAGVITMMMMITGARCQGLMRGGRVHLVTPTKRATIAVGDQKTSRENSDSECIFPTTRGVLVTVILSPPLLF